MVLFLQSFNINEALGYPVGFGLSESNDLKDALSDVEVDCGSGL